MIWTVLFALLAIAVFARGVWRQLKRPENHHLPEPPLVEINGVIEGCDSEDKFFDEFVEFLESKGYRFGGSIGLQSDDKYEEDE